jgi:hypothetical protein
MKEQYQNIWFGQPKKLVEGEYQFTHGHNVQLQSTTIVSLKPSYMEQLELHPNNMNTQEGHL